MGEEIADDGSSGLVNRSLSREPRNMPVILVGRVKLGCDINLGALYPPSLLYLSLPLSPSPSSTPFPSPSPPPSQPSQIQSSFTHKDTRDHHISAV